MGDSVDLSYGVALHDLYNYPNLDGTIIDGDGIVAENIRDQHFRLYLVIVNGPLPFHTTRSTTHQGN